MSTSGTCHSKGRTSVSKRLMSFSFWSWYSVNVNTSMGDYDLAPVPLDACAEPSQDNPVAPAADLSQAVLFEFQPPLETAAAPLASADAVERPFAIDPDVAVATNPWKRMAIELGAALQTLVS